MKKLLLVSIVIIMTFLLFGCSTVSDKLSGEEIDDVSIFYGVSSYAMFGASEDTLKALINQFSSLSFEPTNQEMDMLTMLSINFYHNKKRISSFKVDAKGVFWLDGDTKCYKASSGSFDYKYVKKIYQDSINN